MTFRRFNAAVSFVALTIAVAPAPLRAQEFSTTQTTEIEAIVRDYLIRNPEVLLEALDALETKRAAEQVAAQRSAIEESGDALLATPAGTVLGNPEGDVTVVEFFDYNCGYCKQAMADMDALIASDPNIRFVLKEIPVLGPESLAASRVSLAVRSIAPEKYGEFHRQLLSSRGTADEAKAIEVAGNLDIDEAELRAALDSSDVAAALEESNRLGTLLQITGTPSYVVADQLISGAVGAESLAAKVANVRECSSATC